MFTNESDESPFFFVIKFYNQSIFISTNIENNSIICNNTGFASFDLTTKEADMAGTTPISTIVFRYYENQIDALANTNNTITNVTSFTNSFRNYQKIFVRINNVNHSNMF